MGLYRDWRRRRILRTATLPDDAWRQARRRLPLLDNLSAEEASRLRDLALLFLHEKRFSGAHGLQIEPHHRLPIALQAVLPILHLGPDWLDDWREVILYADEFIVDQQEQDAAGVVHQYREARSGESWHRGPLILSWADVRSGGHLDGYNVVIHEIAHKLDGRSGDLDGMPPLHRGMSARRWIDAFTTAYDELNQLLDAGAETLLDPYAAEAPAEFFAVVSESFFETPHFLAAYYPALYEQLALFYRQDPRQRLEY
jgi:MtfA peptidase